MDEYRPNSNAYKEDQKKKLDKVVSGEVKVKSESPTKKLWNQMIIEDFENVKNYILLDVLIPSLKAAVSDMITNGIDMLLYGESGARGGSHRSGGRNYSSYYRRDESRRRADPSPREESRNTYTYKAKYEFDDISFKYRGDAEEVKWALLKQQDEQDGFVSVADFKDLCGISSEYTDNKYGWKNLDSDDIRVERMGPEDYILRLPRVRTID